MSFNTEAARRRAIFRTFLRFAGADNPSISGVLGPNPHLYGFVGDNVGDDPVLNEAISLGRFTRSVSNDRLSIETPKTSVSLKRNADWVRWASSPLNLHRRTMKLVGRLRQDDGTYLDQTLLEGLSREPEFEGGAINFSLYDTFGELFGRSIPRDRVTIEDWPFARPEDVNKPYPIIYGKVENKLDSVPEPVGALSSISGVQIANFQGAVSSGGESREGRFYYAIAPVLDDIVLAEPVVCFVDIVGDDQKLELTWDAYAGPGDKLRIWQSGGSDFNFFDVYGSRFGAPGPLANDIDASEVGVTILTPGYGATRDNAPKAPTLPHEFEQDWPEKVWYWVTATVAGAEIISQPVVLDLKITNFRSQRYVTLTWPEVDGATSIKVRRGHSVYRWNPWLEYEWDLPGNATSIIDWLQGTTPTTALPAEIRTPRPGCIKCLHVKTNNSENGTFDYVVARHACKQVLRVYVTKTPITEQGTPGGSIERPDGLTATVGGTPGTTHVRYKMTALNGNGETTASEAVQVTNAADPITGTDYVQLNGNSVAGAAGYRFYKSKSGEPFGLVAEEASPSWRDEGTTPDDNRRVPEANTTGTHFASSEGPTLETPILQTEGVDYTVSLDLVDGKVCTVLHFRADQSTHDVTADVWGIEDVGDGSGELIEGFFAQFKHFLLNWVFADYQSGAWFTSSPYVNSDSFDAAQAATEDRVDGGYIGAGFLDAETPTHQAIYDWLLCCDADLYYWDGQIKISLPESAPDTTSAVHLSPQDGIDDYEPFKTVIDDSLVFQSLPWEAGPQQDGFLTSGRVTNSDIDLGYVGRTPDTARTLRWLRKLSTIADVMARKLADVAEPKIYATFPVAFRVLVSELSKPILVDHPEGISYYGGWKRKVTKLIRSDVDLNKKRLSITVEAPSSDTRGIVWEELMAGRFLGGSRHEGLDTFDSTVRMFNWLHALIPYATMADISVPITASVRLWATVADGVSGTATAHVYRSDTDALLASAATDVTSSSDIDEPIDIPIDDLDVDVEVHIRWTFTGSVTAADVRAVAEVRLEAA